MLHVASVCTPCCMLLDVVAQSLKQVKLLSRQFPTFLLFRDRRSVAQQCWIRLLSFSNTVGATLAHYAWVKKTYGLYPSHDALQAPTLLLGVVASICTPLPTRTQQLPTMLAQQCWEPNDFLKQKVNCVWARGLQARKLALQPRAHKQSLHILTPAILLKEKNNSHFPFLFHPSLLFLGFHYHLQVFTHKFYLPCCK